MGKRANKKFAGSGLLLTVVIVGVVMAAMAAAAAVSGLTGMEIYFGFMQSRKAYFGAEGCLADAFRAMELNPGIDLNGYEVGFAGGICRLRIIESEQGPVLSSTFQLGGYFQTVESDI